MNKLWEMEPCFTDEEAWIEADRCLSCKNPMCEKGCPTSMRIRDFIKEIKNRDLSKAYDIIHSCSSLPYICSIVCPHENQCQGHCILGIKGKPIACGSLERYVVENVKKPEKIETKSSKKVAVIGAGPAGISCAKELAKHGVQVEIYEATSYFGGVLSYGIPSYRLEYPMVQRIKEELDDLGVKVIYNRPLKESEIIELKKTYDAVFISIGLTKVKKLAIPNENLKGVYDALDFLKMVNDAVKFKTGSLPKLDGTTIIIGAGNVAMDAARSAVRLGSKALVVYRRSRLEAPATKHEIAMAEAEGVTFKFLNSPVEVLKDSAVCGLRVEIMELGEPDASGRRRPVGTNKFEDIPCNRIISAIGQSPEDIYDAKVLKTDYNYLVCDGLKTNLDGIYAGGDIVLGAKTVVEAMVCGRNVANMILEK